MTRRLQFTAPLLLVALAACGPGDDADAELPVDATAEAPADAASSPDATMPPPVDPAPMAGDAGAMPSQPEALALLIAVNEHEIAAAEQAREKQVEGEVMEYADMMLADHTANLEATRELADTTATDVADSPRLSSLRATGEAALDRLSGLEGQEYAQAYIEAMVEDHSKALDMLDNQLIPAAQDAPVREHLTMTRDTIAQHLEQARALQSQAPAQ